MPTYSGEYVWIRRRELLNKEFVYGEKISVRASLLIRMEPLDECNINAVGDYQDYGHEGKEPTVTLTHPSQPQLDRTNQMRIHFKAPARGDIKSRLGIASEVTECVCHACVYVPYPYRMTPRMQEAYRAHIKAFGQNKPNEEVWGQCTLKPILAEMVKHLDLFTEENLDSIWMYKDMGNRLLKQEGQDVDESRGELMSAREALKNNFGKSLNGVVVTWIN